MGERVEAEFVSEEEDSDEGDLVPTWRERLQDIDVTVRAFAAERPLVAFGVVIAAGYLIGRMFRRF